MNESNGVAPEADSFDRAIGMLHGLPDVLATKMASIRASVTQIVGDVKSYSVQTYRQAKVGDTIFLECTDKNGTIRMAIPPKVARIIARQADSLSARSRSKHSKEVALARKERGELPGFMKKAPQPSEEV